MNNMFGIDIELMNRIVSALLRDDENSMKKSLIIIVGNSTPLEVMRKLEDKLLTDLHKRKHGNIWVAECTSGRIYNVVHSKDLTNQMRGMKVGEISFVI